MTIRAIIRKNIVGDMESLKQVPHKLALAIVLLAGTVAIMQAVGRYGLNFVGIVLAFFVFTVALVYWTFVVFIAGLQGHAAGQPMYKSIDDFVNSLDEVAGSRADLVEYLTDFVADLRDTKGMDEQQAVTRAIAAFKDGDEVNTQVTVLKNTTDYSYLKRLALYLGGATFVVNIVAMMLSMDIILPLVSFFVVAVSVPLMIYGAFQYFIFKFLK